MTFRYVATRVHGVRLFFAVGDAEIKRAVYSTSPQHRLSGQGTRETITLPGCVMTGTLQRPGDPPNRLDAHIAGSCAADSAAAAEVRRDTLERHGEHSEPGNRARRAPRVGGNGRTTDGEKGYATGSSTILARPSANELLGRNALTSRSQTSGSTSNPPPRRRTDRTRRPVLRSIARCGCRFR